MWLEMIDFDDTLIITKRRIKKIYLFKYMSLILILLFGIMINVIKLEVYTRTKESNVLRKEKISLMIYLLKEMEV